MALAMAIFALGPISAPLVGYGLVALTGWRGVFIGMAVFGGLLLAWGALWFKETNTAPDATALRPDRLRQSLRRIASHPQSRYFLIVAAATQFGIISFVANGPRFFKSAFGIDGLEFALLFATTGLGIVLGQIANNRLIARLGVLTTTRIAAFVLLAVTTLVVLLSLADALTGVVFTGLMFMFNTSFLVVMANAASLVIDPHREIAGFASSAYGFFTQITASVLAVLTVPLFAGALLPWSLTMLAVTLSVFVLITVYRPAGPFQPGQA
jgi:DHA1 family bicyclomycin/chloramphenicol resistance-like MFS transporter